MHETNEDLRALQLLLEASYARAGSHLRSIWGPEDRLDADQVRTELTEVEVLNLATVTPSGEPRVAPVDGLFFGVISGSARRRARHDFETYAPTRRSAAPSPAGFRPSS